MCAGSGVHTVANDTSDTSNEGATCGYIELRIACAAITLLVAGCGGSGSPATTRTVARHAPATPRPNTASTGEPPDCDSVTTCYTPEQIEVAYGIRPLLKRGIDGHGETVVLPELAVTRLSAPAVSDLRHDMSRFDGLFGLPRARLRVVTTIAGSAAPWLADGEEVLDAETVHAVAPAAAITVLRVKPTSLDDPANAIAAAVAAIRLGTRHGGVISISAAGQTGGEHCDTPTETGRLNAALETAAARHVTVVAASGDIGAVGEPCAVIRGLTGGAFPPVKEVNLPAADPLVLAAGGTTLNASHTTGAYVSETAWGLPFGTPGTQFQASGGGFSRRFARPAYQDGVASIGATRGVPDVSADASPHTGMSGGHQRRRQPIHHPQQRRHQHHRTPLGRPDRPRRPVRPPPPRVRQPRHLPDRPQRRRITKRSTTSPTATTRRYSPATRSEGYRAEPGWDPVTGWGTPNAQALIPLLARYATPMNQKRRDP